MTVDRDRYTKSVKSQGWRRPVVAVAGMMLSMLIVLGATVLVFGGADQLVGGALPTTTQPSPPSTLAQMETSDADTLSTTDVTAPLALPSELAMVWERVDSAPAFEQAWMRAMAVGGPGLVAVGSTEHQGAAIWTSEDGRTWQRLQVDGLAPLEGEEERYLWDVAIGPEGMVAIGGVNGEDAGHDAAMILHSTDGISWSDAGNSPALDAVTHTPSGFIAVGFGDAPGIWSSDDGRVWAKVVDPSLATSLEARPGYEAPYFTDITSGGPGLVAVGCEVPLESGYSSASDPDWQAWMNRNPAIWVSTDGVTWERLADSAVVDPRHELHSPNGVTAGVPTCVGSLISTDEGLFGLGDWGDRIWNSDDGYTWTISQEFAPTDRNEPMQLDAIAADGGQIVAVGQGPSLEHNNTDRPPWYGSAVFWTLDKANQAWHRVGLLEAINRVGMVDTVNMPYTTPSVADDIVAYRDGFVVVGHAGYYSPDVNEELAGNWCGFEDEWTGSCRTDAAVWIGSWTNN